MNSPNPSLTSRSSPRPPVSGPKHDSLHMAEGLTYCWCMCQRCWLRYGGDTGGICICRQCPCEAAYQATRPMYVPRQETAR